MWYSFFYVSNKTVVKYSDYCIFCRFIHVMYQTLCGCEKWIVCDREKLCVEKKNWVANIVITPSRINFKHIFHIWKFTKITCTHRFLCQIEWSVELFGIWFKHLPKTVGNSFCWVGFYFLFFFYYLFLIYTIVSSFSILHISNDIFNSTMKFSGKPDAITRKQQKLLAHSTI